MQTSKFPSFTGASNRKFTRLHKSMKGYINKKATEEHKKRLYITLFNLLYQLYQNYISQEVNSHLLLKRIKKREERQAEEIRYGHGIYVFLGKVLSRRAPRWGAMTKRGRK